MKVGAIHGKSVMAKEFSFIGDPGAAVVQADACRGVVRNYLKARFSKTPHRPLQPARVPPAPTARNKCWPTIADCDRSPGRRRRHARRDRPAQAPRCCSVDSDRQARRSRVANARATMLFRFRAGEFGEWLRGLSSCEEWSDSSK